MRTKMGLTAICCCLIVLGCLSLSCCDRGVDAPVKRAIIMLPGLEGSALFDAESDELCWALTPEVFEKVENESYFRGKDSYIAALFDSDPNGVPLWKMRAGDMSDEKFVRYSLMDVFKPAYDFFSKNYSDRYDVLIWQYDWRDSNERNAEKLENFVNEKQYDELVFLTHSMGGHVVNCFLRKEQNRKKVKLYVPIAVPFYGSAYVYDTICIEYDDPLYHPKDVIPDIFGHENWQKGSRRIIAPYQLLPSDELGEWNIYSDNTAFPSPYSLDNSPLTSAEVFEVWSETYDWFNDAQQSPLLSVKNTVSYYESMYVDIDGNRVHVAETVPLEIIYGVGISTRYAVNADEERINAVASTEYGDNVVTVYSATLGKVSDASEPGEGLWRIDGVKHMSIPSSDAGMNAIKSIAKKYLG